MQIEMTVKKRKPRSRNIVNQSCVFLQFRYVQNNSVIHSILLINLSEMPQVFGRMFEYLTPNKQICCTNKSIFINSVLPLHLLIQLYLVSRFIFFFKLWMNKSPFSKTRVITFQPERLLSPPLHATLKKSYIIPTHIAFI